MIVIKIIILGHQDQTNGDSAPVGNEIPIDDDIHIENSVPNGTQDPTQTPLINPEPSSSGEPELDPEMLLALGEYTSDSPDYGEKILESQARLWLPLLKKGIQKENKEKLLKEYTIPDNCRLLQAPKLNAEIAAAIPDMVRNRDKNTLCTQQQQLGSGITAINRAMDLLLLGGDKIQAIKHLSNGCRLLSDLHCQFTQCRTKLITPSLDKTCLNVIHDTERDETLFGAKLSEKIKAAKSIERQGLQIKKAPPQKTTAGTSQQTGTYRQPYQGNWQAPPRYPSNRGGRGGYRRQAPAAGSRRSNQTASSTKNVPPNKSRATTQH